MSDFDLIRLYGSSVTVQAVDKSLKFDDEFQEVINGLLPSPKMKTVSDDVHITKENVTEKSGVAPDQLVKIHGNHIVLEAFI
ncbi:hypothetical protein [Tepidibacillus marianensis]|uniref:hypothetical protein n=1 Tax=Tepidibacillus marianensis TaxID=3131995 RepID=UPI0030CAFA86